MPQKQHLLAIVEPTPGGDTTLDLAHDTVAQGGSASVVMVVTDRIKRDIRAFADAEGLDRGEAEALALDQLRSHYSARIGGEPDFVTHYGPVDRDVVKHVTADTTAIAIPTQLANGKLVDRLATNSGRPVTVTPQRPTPSAA